jgi:hypothetical protein
MSKFENFWRDDKNDKELNKEIEEGTEEVLDSSNPNLEADVDDREEERVPPGLIDAAEFFYENGEEKAEEIFGWYEKAITRRGREALGSGSFMYHFFTGGSHEKNYMYGDDHDGYLLGIVRHGAFIPTHFAPRTMRGGYNLIKELGESQYVPVVLAITDDLAETIKKMPSWHNLGINFPAHFRDEIHNKQLVYNSHPDIERLLPLLAEDYLNEARGFDDSDPDDGDFRDGDDEENETLSN